MGFEQATIGVVNAEQFETLAGAIRRVFAPEAVERYLGKVASQNTGIRDWDNILRLGLLESCDAELAKRGGANALYGSLAVSDQAQMRELYLTQVEEVAPALRAKFNKVYRYY